MNNIIEEFWDDCHSKNVRASLTGSPYEALINALRLEPYIKEYNNVLEIGPGLGYVTKGLHERGLNVSCLDISKVALTRVEKYCKKTYTVDDLDELPPDYFDIIICANVVQHIPTDLLVSELEYCIRSLKSTGIFAIEFVSNSAAEDTGVDACIDTVKGGLCCRSPKYLEKIIIGFGGVCELVDDVKCNSSGITGCHVFHVRKEK